MFFSIQIQSAKSVRLDFAEKWQGNQLQTAVIELEMLTSLTQIAQIMERGGRCMVGPVSELSKAPKFRTLTYIKQ